jgi:DnaA family protein
MLFSPQIPLQLEPSRESRFENFVPGPNIAVVEALKSVAGETDSQLFLSGPEGTGKTHLLNALCLAVREQGMTAFYAGLRSMPEGSQALLEGLETVDLVCVDDLHCVAGNAAWEEALFHCLNRIRSSHGRVVFTSQSRLSALPLSLPDLESRLQWGLRMQLQLMDDADKITVLDRYAASLGIEITSEVGGYLIRHSSRNLSHLLQTVEQLQQAAFVSKRRITVPLAREVLRRDSGD